MNIFNVWMGLSPLNRVISIASVVATMALLFLLTATTLKPKTDLLYSGLDPAAAGEVIAALQTMDVTYEVRGSSIYADANRRDSLRLELAREGLPRQSLVGYELFDTMNSFTMTSDMFNTAYWRAKEGELARTLLAMPNIRSARVHLGTQKSSGFTSGSTAQSGSVTISSGGTLSAQQAKAIQYLTALSVSGLKPDDVAVIDTAQGVIAGPGLGTDMASGAGNEVERAAQIKQNLVSLLEARVGAGNARVNVSLDVERKHVTTAERNYDPDSRVLRSQTTSEISDTSTGSRGNVTVASNLPEGDAGNGEASSERSETTETVTYEIAEVVRNTETLPGDVKRITVAVLINDIVSRNDAGEIIRTPRDAAELQALEELVSAAAGLDASRGDTLQLRSLAFDLPESVDLIEQPGVMAQFMDRYLWSTVQAALLGLVVLLLGVFVVRPLLTQKPEDNNPDLLPMSLDGSQSGLPDAAEGQLAIAGQTPGETLRIEQGEGAEGAAGQAPGNDGNAANPSDPIEQLKAITSNQATDAADLLASWLDQDARKAG